RGLCASKLAGIYLHIAEHMIKFRCEFEDFERIAPTTHSSRQAPRTAVNNVHSQPPLPRPTSESNQPPTTPPTMPTTIFVNRPWSRFIIFSAKKPAMAPIIIQPIILMVILLTG